MVAVPERLRPREERLPYGELPALRRPVQRARSLRVLLALALAATFVAALAVAFSRDAQPSALLPAGTDGMIVLDLSASTGAKASVGELFRRIAAADEPTGLAVFSDGSYEVLPPGTPGRDLAPMMRFFVPGSDGDLVPDPWSSGFAGGTNVLAGIQRALDSFERDEVTSGSILLISDLEFVPDQIARLPALLTELRETRIEIRILPVDARPEQRRFFERVLGPEAFVDVDEAKAIATGSGSSSERRLFQLAEDGTPWLFALLAAVLLGLLAANERLCARLTLPAPARTGR
jgi:hypothetical protein